MISMKNIYLLLMLLAWANLTFGQVREAPNRYRGDGPHEQLIIRGITLINGNGAPPRGPIDIVVEKEVPGCSKG